MTSIRGLHGFVRLALGAALVGAAGCTSQPAIRQTLRTERAPAAIGPYAQAVSFGNLLFVSGQIGLEPRSGRMVEGGIREQTAQALENLRAILAAAGLGLEDVLQAQVFLADLDDFAAYNEVWAARFTAPPTRFTVQAARLPRDARVEIAVIAGRAEPHAR